MDALKGIEKIIQENAFEQKEKKPRLKFNPGSALIGLRTTGPRLVSSVLLAQRASEVVWEFKITIEKNCNNPAYPIFFGGGGELGASENDSR